MILRRWTYWDFSNAEYRRWHKLAVALGARGIRYPRWPDKKLFSVVTIHSNVVIAGRVADAAFKKATGLEWGTKEAKHVCLSFERIKCLV